MPRTVIGLGDEALAEATRRVGATAEKDTAGAALRETADRRRRAEAITCMRQLVAEGEIDFSAFPTEDSDSGKPTAGPIPT